MTTKPVPLSQLDEATVRAANPTLDDVQGPRAWLHPQLPQSGGRHLANDSAATLLKWVDEVVEHQCNGSDNAQPKQSTRYTRVSHKKLGPQTLQLYTSHSASPAFLAATLSAGYFSFGSECDLPNHAGTGGSASAYPIEERALLNLELCSRRREPVGEASRHPTKIVYRRGSRRRRRVATATYIHLCRAY